ncbi:hypothetical protein Bca52824_066702 [Brassica carinata]|uniref:Uncharacterized protein n=1 Tax=Brassica carinata TaxID=52824 RepID=A0A8X7UAX5_BRACI|nr:hypothetical protein Bca52824_066702 [Brassica carinata]
MTRSASLYAQLMIMPTSSSPTRSCFFRDHLVSPVNGCSLVTTESLSSCGLTSDNRHMLYSALATSSSTPPLEACSWLQALLQAPKGTEENRGHDQCGLSSRSTHGHLQLKKKRDKFSNLVI